MTIATTQQTATAAAQTVVSGITRAPMSDLVTGMSFGNGLVAQAGYDQDYRLRSLGLKDGVTPIIGLTYAYADGMNLTAITDTVTAANTAGLTYTAANRLASGTGPWGSYGWSYDGVGNRLSEAFTPTGGTLSTKVSVLPGTSNRVSAITLGTATTRSFTYDAAGNVLTDVRGADTYAFTYNARNRPVTMTRTGTASATSTYASNGLEQMVSRTSNAAGAPAGTVQYIYDTSGHLIAETDAATGATTREYIWLAANDNDPVDLPLALVTGVNTATPVLSYVYTDHLGRPVRMTSVAKAAVWQASYNPFGEVRTLSGNIEQNLRFPGQYFLIEGGLAYNWHRLYDASTGRYTQADPMRFVDGPSVYAYAGGSPYQFVDRTGEAMDPAGMFCQLVLMPVEPPWRLAFPIILLERWICLTDRLPVACVLRRTMLQVSRPC